MIVTPNAFYHFTSKAKHDKVVCRLIKKHKGLKMKNMVAPHIVSILENDMVYYMVGFDKSENLNAFSSELKCELNRLNTGIKEIDSRPGFFKKWYLRITSVFKKG